MGNYKILNVTKIILHLYWYLQLAFIAAIILIGLLLFFDAEFIDLNYLNGFKIQFSKVNFIEPLVYDGMKYDFSLPNGEGRLHINDLDQKFVYLRMLAALIDSLIYLMIIYFARKIFENLTDNKYFVAVNGMYIKKIAIAIIFLSFVPGTIHYLTDLWVLKTIEQQDIIMKAGFSVDFQTILLGLLVFVISIIFLRGVELKEDQELTI